MPGAPADVRGTTISFDSVDGPPPAVVQRIVRDLSTEATARQIVVVPRGGQAMYRVRGYLAAHADQGQTAIAWAWDVYDGEQRHVFRLRGEDKAVAASRSWTAADDQTLRRIARTSVEQLVVFLGSPRTPAGRVAESAPSPAPRSLSILAGLDDFTPEAAGIFRVLRQAPVPLALDAAPEALPGEVPLPRGRPAPGAPISGALAYADPGL
jgi:hypothetical protein